MLEIKTLEEATNGQITEAFNLAFSDYSVPIVLSEDQLKDKFISEGVRLDLSVGAFDNNILVGFILHFVGFQNDKKYIYNGGTGVIPSHRGKQLTSQMYDFIFPILREEQVDCMILEVFTDNLSASRIYQKQGFEIRREVACFNGVLCTRETTLNEEYEIVELENPNWDRLSSFWDYPPTWQNSISVMNNIISQLLFLAVKKEDEVLGYVLFNTKSKRIHQLAIADKHRNKGLATALLNAICELTKEKVSFNNIDVRTKGMKDLLEKRGLSNFVNQFEMEMELDQKN